MLTNVFEGLRNYFGDLHNHCAIGYGHGSIEDAYQNARLQLDFACVTAHSYWPDMPDEGERLASVVAYHQKGFQRAAEEWEHLRAAAERNNEAGRFVSFLGFEWHSMLYGDHHVLFKGQQGEIIRAADLAEMRRELRSCARRGCDGILLPHHIGYKQGYRGINWETFYPEFSPVVEIISMHGASESDEAPYPYLHTMGPRDWRSTLQYGLAQGKIVGVVGSTDHHSAHPGSYGHGRLGLWARELTRDGIWEAIQSRCTYALTGDRIELEFSINGAPMGSVLPANSNREIELAITGGDELDYVELVHNNRLVQRWNATDLANTTSGEEQPIKICFEVGWGVRNANVDWQASLQVIDGELLSVEPRFRGHEVVAPQSKEEEKYVFSRWEREGKNGVRFSTRTWGNPTTTTASTQGLCLELAGNPQTHVRASINGKSDDIVLTDLMRGSKAGYLGGFLTPAYCFHRAVPYSRYHYETRWSHRVESQMQDWYYVRVRQKNNQYAWSSPIWISAP